MREKKSIDKIFEIIATLSIDKSSQLLSKFVKGGARIELKDVYYTDISKVTEKFTGSEAQEVVGAFLDLQGDAFFKFLFYVNTKDSLSITDLILQRDVGTTKELDVSAMSAIQEIGNILASAVSNIFVNDFQIDLKPTPPEMVHDYESTIFQEYIMKAATEKDEILMIESVFRIAKLDIFCKMFILPINNSEEILNYIARSD